MRVVIGPVSASSAAAWLDVASRAIAALDELTPTLTTSVPDASAILGGYVARWQDHITGAVEQFWWETDMPVEVAQYHLHVFHQLATAMYDRSGEHTGRWAWPSEGDAFYRALLLGVLGALRLEGGEYAAYARDVADRWPGLQAVTT